MSAPRLSPELVAATLRLDRLPIEHLPWRAADLLANGYDGEALRELAGLGADDPHAIRDVVPTVLGDLGVAWPETVVDAAALIFDDLAAGCLAGEIDEIVVVQLRNADARS